METIMLTVEELAKMNNNIVEILAVKEKRIGLQIYENHRPIV